MNKFEVIYDGPSRPIIQTPTGKWLSLSQFESGRWESYADEDKDCHTIVNALNWILEFEEREAACCPEDVGFEEYIRRLESELAHLRGGTDEAKFTYRSRILNCSLSHVHDTHCYQEGGKL